MTGAYRLHIYTATIANVYIADTRREFSLLNATFRSDGDSPLVLMRHINEVAIFFTERSSNDAIVVLCCVNTFQ